MNIDEELLLPEQLNLHYKVFLNLIYTTTWLCSKVEKELKKFKLTLPQYHVLLILKRSEGTLLSAIGIQKRMIHPECNVTRLIEKLIKKELVSKEPCDENRRKMIISITKKGLQMLNKTSYINLYNISVMEKMFSILDSHEMNTILDKIRATFIDLSLNSDKKDVVINDKGL